MRTFHWLMTAAAVAALTGCETILPLAGRLIATAVGNYDSKYGKLVEDLTKALQKRPSGETTKASEPLTLEVALLRQEDRGDQIVPVPIRNGDPLFWRESEAASDRFKIFFRPNEACFVYVVLIDSTGFVQVLHPADGFAIVTSADEGRFLPEGDLDLAYAVDEHRGVETIYFVAARERRADLEQVLAPFVGLERPQPATDMGVPADAGHFLELGVADRSAGRAAEVRSGDRMLRFPTEAFLEAAGRDLVVTRWFDHR
ncbi:MAG: DUF4384 domain-containing protein [bacterium]|nr:DUF4384 domain-containing protein [bacterium]